MKAKERDELLKTLEERFAANPQRHSGVVWADVLAKLGGWPEALRSIHEMEKTGGEPDVVVLDTGANHIVFCDCSVESPAGRRSLCFDQEALEARKKNKPRGSAAGMAAEVGVDLLTEEQYRALQKLGEFDLKTSSWVATPPEVRALGGAIFCDRRYGRVFTYHNGAQSYYAARGFRGVVRV
ncbi:MAG: DUF4256 domain-containing protein [Acidobacteriota bacterium]